MGATLVFITILSSGEMRQHPMAMEYTWDDCIEALQNTSHKISHGPEQGFSSFVTCEPTLSIEE